MQIRGEDRKGRLDGVPTDEISPCDAYLTSGLLVVVVLQARGIDESVDKTPSKLENLSPPPIYVPPVSARLCATGLQDVILGRPSCPG